MFQNDLKRSLAPLVLAGILVGILGSVAVGKTDDEPSSTTARQLDDEIAALPLNASPGAKRDAEAVELPESIESANEPSPTPLAQRRVMRNGESLLLLSADRKNAWAYTSSTGGWSRLTWEQPLAREAQILLGPHVICIVDGNRCDAFSTLVRGGWERLVLEQSVPGSIQQFDDLIVVPTATHLHVFSGTAGLWSHVETPRAITPPTPSDQD